MEYLEAPDYHLATLNGNYPRIFLAGGITGCPDWQAQVVERIRRLPHGLILNPRRASFDVSDPSAAATQIEWEFIHLWNSDVVLFWFCKETIQPIALLELGARLTQHHMFYSGFAASHFKPPTLIVGVEPGYPRAQDVFHQTRLAFTSNPKNPKPLIASSLLELINTTLASLDHLSRLR